MLIVKQIERILYDFLGQGGGDANTIRETAEKIAALSDDNGAAVAAAMLENEITSTLMDMTVATVLATLIEEEGGGRSNISISPMSMEHMHQNYLYEVRNEGLIRHVSIKMREDSPLQDEANWREPSHRHGLTDVAPTPPLSVDDLKPQAEPHEYNRPVWAVRFWCATGDGFRPELAQCADREEATKRVRGYHDDDGRPDATIENRWCLHAECPSTGCNHDPALRDAPEATSESAD
ncbi:MAG: hypothetical protein E6Q97_37995 [Desulfurellales bacterium]|nr:MAG: hypothetical protein E6Q97_37995 [Desulfurellales bacterium]